MVPFSAQMANQFRRWPNGTVNSLFVLWTIHFVKSLIGRRPIIAIFSNIPPAIRIAIPMRRKLHLRGVLRRRRLQVLPAAEPMFHYPVSHAEAMDGSPK